MESCQIPRFAAISIRAFPGNINRFRVVGRAPRYAHAGRRRDSQGEVCNPGLLSWRRTLGHKITSDDMEVPGINNKILS
jgi:hypothetical protein